ncbi:spore cortex biosynthesis protein YabQ [Agathobaculum sp.]|uniref:spore cortex biosynthesis protein YabQ n=1 Tax=Agathobaculum sp. TaxID=2048138 RepID=UPI002A7F4529|nr:spore cortex biosynthesis protein YabQ [Agathobaculum sp.]MDY3617901.1 spore cortex biosynthesis protein YabQ [Agathobaculum sp.]
MFLPLQEQALTVLQSVLLGVGIGFYYDVLRAFRRHVRAGAALTALCDALFWLGLLAALFEFSLVFAPGQNRYYVLAGAAVGGLLYFALPSELVLGLLSLVLDALSFVRKKIVQAARWVRALAVRLEIRKKIRGFVKKFEKSSSIFRKKGIK